MTELSNTVDLLLIQHGAGRECSVLRPPVLPAAAFNTGPAGSVACCAHLYSLLLIQYGAGRESVACCAHLSSLLLIQHGQARRVLRAALICPPCCSLRTGQAGRVQRAAPPVLDRTEQALRAAHDCAVTRLPLPDTTSIK